MEEQGQYPQDYECGLLSQILAVHSIKELGSSVIGAYFHWDECPSCRRNHPDALVRLAALQEAIEQDVICGLEKLKSEYDLLQAEVKVELLHPRLPEPKSCKPSEPPRSTNEAPHPQPRVRPSST